MNMFTYEDTQVTDAPNFQENALNGPTSHKQ